MTLFDKKMVRRCGVWQIKRMTSSFDEIKHVRFWGLFTNEVLKMPEIGQEGKFWVWFGLVMSRLSHLLGLDPFFGIKFVPISKTASLNQQNFSSF